MSKLVSDWAGDRIIPAASYDGTAYAEGYECYSALSAMPEQRGRQHHRGRVASTFSEEITAMLEGELSDPRIAPCHITEVILAPGGKSCRVLVAVVGTEQEEKSTLEGLMAARGYIRTEIRERMGVRHVPELTFAIDRSEKINARMEQLLGRAGKHREKIQKKTGAPVEKEQETGHA